MVDDSLNETANLPAVPEDPSQFIVYQTFEEGELDRAATVAESATVQAEGPRQVERRIEHYNLDVIRRIHIVSAIGRW
ncbi:MAG: hypothetical protein EHM35_05195 [Planctomycetaceae bacterium]|nr:MAG: hypothetical protein EHM35_05195 [Planctomycetaceae bacterium]